MTDDPNTPNDNGGGSTPTEGGGATPTGAQPGTQPQSGGEQRTFTQDEVNQLVAKEKRDWKTKFGDEDTQRKAQEYDKLEEAKKTEVQKLTDKASTAETERDSWKGKYHDLAGTVHIERVATELGIVDPEAAARLIDRGGLEADSEGLPKRDDVKKALEALIERKPYLQGKAPRPTGSGDGGTRQPAAGSGSAGFWDQVRERAGK